MTKKPTLTIGIPAYNEENNIRNLIESILIQRQDNFKLEKIIVACDRCSDKTEEVVKSISQNNKNVHLISGKKRVGKSSRLNQLYSLNNSDLILTIDGDVILSEPSVISKMVNALKKKNVLAVSANNQPVKARKFTEKIYNAGYKMWYEIRKDYQNGSNLNNVHGMANCLRKPLARSIKYPQTTADGAYLFLMTKKQGGEFRFVKDALVLFSSPNNINDFVEQALRNLRSKHHLAKLLGAYIYEEQKIPKKFKIKGILKSLIADPLYTTLAIFFNIWIRKHPGLKQESYENGVWKISRSTKRAINIKMESSLA